MDNQIVFHCTLDPRPGQFGFEVERLLAATDPEQAKELYIQVLAKEGILAQPQDVVVTETDLPSESERGLPDSDEETDTEPVTPMAKLVQQHPIAQAIEALKTVNPDAKIENQYLGGLEPGRQGWGLTILGPSVSLSSVLRIPHLELIEMNTKRTGRFTRTHLVFLAAGEPVGEAAPVDPEDQQHQAICQRMDVDALLILGVKRPGAHRPEQGQQTLIGLEHTGLTLGELLGLTQRMLRDTNQAYMNEGEQAPFPFVSETGQSGGHLFAPKPKKIITLN